jgi:competence protein ComFC
MRLNIRFDLCLACFKALSDQQISLWCEHACSVCGKPLLHENQSCTHDGLMLRVDRLFCYRYMIRDLISYYKFQNEKNLAFLFARLVYRYMDSHELEDALIVPIPSSRRGRSSRGFDQAAEIASVLSEHYHVDVCLHLLVRRAGSFEQKQLNRVQRMQSGRRRFSVNKREQKRLHGRHILLFDDILTTGGSLNEAAALIREIHSGEITALVLATD